ncbi:hypothetical protein A2962_00960 [Candidatus Woesebacteria bacterium RIFCSPLOWO2_01_FULL_39_61]|uniref:Glycosyltransferase 2-like domain-containing protein n=1 Tax=Candidatus Woesebacteria bacterium RIFCSPHIGHO2_02_FULL_39_13 TaxID=1802505 RepID=A0A1F7Z2Q5_9BACT|nr:MAG: hypothetical protein A2692_00415 [Candidatus Woesebacteria bacterium RIFCSPHIGHO2_01_FULL_39_95]OGM33359.1 MAG: hypothetical protein A3D01_00465 [Candidatus Woesebacteria bacterium RIFCSPHIGHO2_02_FULL_39_13]OGM36282.1 MAG: hypothetical protein A3E13_03555 [Candidatus Woesebacteria bacterium RIFCSPHIGHO2_12_FULL_40_20]OGM68480.1 MAG: hypothetical protein A2962_00960 [Candidatus Woesebacteria bacterium RIFCSPLOWO2_01_FULL_39_61]OGM71307.1 MAG: hypothetical protein A3H19_02950 [Candidatus
MSLDKSAKETFILVMPAYNEEDNIETTISLWIPIINKIPGSEILVINDGSKDKTFQTIYSLSQKYSFLKVINKQNEGHGKTILLGYKKALASRHEWIFQTDSDGHFAAKDFYKLWRMRKTSDFILGYRQKRKDPKYRILLTNLISIWIFILFGKYIKDPNIPFRLIKREYLKNLLKLVPENSFAPNIFLTILAARDHHNLYHIPIKHRPRKKNIYTDIKILKGAFQGFLELIAFALTLIK